MTLFILIALCFHAVARRTLYIRYTFYIQMNAVSFLRQQKATTTIISKTAVEDETKETERKNRIKNMRTKEEKRGNIRPAFLYPFMN